MSEGENHHGLLMFIESGSAKCLGCYHLRLAPRKSLAERASCRKSGPFAPQTSILLKFFDRTATTTEVRILGHHHHIQVGFKTRSLHPAGHVSSPKGNAHKEVMDVPANHIRSPEGANHVEEKRPLYSMYLCCPSHHIKIIRHQSSHLSAIVSLTPYNGTAQH